MKLLLSDVFACCMCLLLLVLSSPLSAGLPPLVDVLHAVWGSGSGFLTLILQMLFK